FGGEIELGHLRRLEVDDVRARLLGRIETGGRDERITGPAQALIEVRSSEGEVLAEIGSEPGDRPVGAIEPPDEPQRAGGSRLPEVDRVTAAMTRELGIAGEARRGRGELGGGLERDPV